MIYWMVFPYVVAGIGFFFYVSHYPEKLIPGQVDFYGNSHQWASQYDGNNFGKIPETLHGCQEVQEITKRLFDALWYAS